VIMLMVYSMTLENAKMILSSISLKLDEDIMCVSQESENELV
jgi:hypothetical protein